MKVEVEFCALVRNSPLKVEVEFCALVPNSPYDLCLRKASVNEQEASFRAQELCESRGGVLRSRP